MPLRLGFGLPLKFPGLVFLAQKEFEGFATQHGGQPDGWPQGEEIERGLGDLKIERRLVTLLVLGVKNLLSLVRISCDETGARHGGRVHTVEHPPTEPPGASSDSVLFIQSFTKSQEYGKPTPHR